MAEIYQAKAAVVKVSVGSASGNRVARIIRAGGIVPEGVEQDLLEKLAKRGLIEKVTVGDDPAETHDQADLDETKEPADPAASKEPADPAASKEPADPAAPKASPAKSGTSAGAKK